MEVEIAARYAGPSSPSHANFVQRSHELPNFPTELRVGDRASIIDERHGVGSFARMERNVVRSHWARPL